MSIIKDPSAWFSGKFKDKGPESVMIIHEENPSKHAEMRISGLSLALTSQGHNVVIELNSHLLDIALSGKTFSYIFIIILDGDEMKRVCRELIDWKLTKQDYNMQFISCWGSSNSRAVSAALRPVAIVAISVVEDIPTEIDFVIESHALDDILEEFAVSSSISRDQRLSVLVVDDSVVIRKLFSVAILKAGNDVDTALHGLEAAEKLEKRHYDVIMMDVSMPKLGGIDATIMIRSAEANQV